MVMPDPFRSGFVAIIGRPNAGKSTLLNHLVGQKISITSRRAQTTRHRILGIKSSDLAQIVYIDTPGLQERTGGTQLNRLLNRTARSGIEGVDVVILVITADGWRPEDEPALDMARNAGGSVILAINKIDQLKDSETLLPLISESGKRLKFEAIVPVSASRNINVERLEQATIPLLPVQGPGFDPEQVTDRSERFVASELVREQIFRAVGQEVPHAVTVEIVEFRTEPKHIHIDAIVWVEKEGQKAILIGKNGDRLKEIGRRARLEMQKFFERKVWLGLWVKVREGWSDDIRSLKALGYGDDQ